MLVLETAQSHQRLAGDVHVEFPIFNVSSLFDNGNNQLIDWGSGQTGSRRRLVFLDQKVWNGFGSQIQNYFKAGSDLSRIEILAFEEQGKTMDAVFKVLHVISDFNPLRRDEPIIVIGGGVLMDVVGFACSMFRRGLPYIRVPTTLIGQIDAGIGVKTGVNAGVSKNRLGAYFAPIACFNDRAFLSTLPERHIRNGMAEILKIAIIKDRYLFDLLEKHQASAIEDRFLGRTDYDAIYECAILGMLDDLNNNLHETSLQRAVDFGHTFGPKLEMVADSGLLHGETVAIDMAISVSLSCVRQMLPFDEMARIIALLAAAGLPMITSHCSPIFLWECVCDAARHRNGLQNLPLPYRIGEYCFVQDVTVDQLALAVETLTTLVGKDDRP